MATRLERERREVQERLRTKALTNAPVARKVGKHDAMLDPASIATLAQIRALLVEIHAMLKKMPEHNMGIEFVVTSRDAQGNVRTFKAAQP